MIIDTSAVVAIINREPEAAGLERALARATSRKIGAPTQVETGLVLTAKFGIRGRTLFERLLQQQDVHVVDFGERHAEVAMEAFHRFGNGRHPAKLNFGDCFSYATAWLAREPLLCVGNDFAQTDLALVKLD